MRIDIPDKICPHCGGIRWLIEYRKKPTKANPDNKLIRYRCVKKGEERNMRWRATHSEALNKSLKKYSQKRRDAGYYKSPKMREYAKLKSQRESNTLNDNFVLRMLMRDTYGIKRSDIPQDLIDLKRTQLQIHRQAKQTHSI